MKKLTTLLSSAVLATGISGLVQAGSFGLGGNLTFVTLDDSETLTVIGGSVETEEAVGGNIVAHLDLGDEGFLQYLATELAVDFSRHDTKIKNSSLGELDAGRVTFLIPSWSVLWMMTPDWNFCPYIGFGVNFVSIRESSSGDVDSIDYDSKFGAHLQAGFKFYPSNAWSLDFDVKKIGFSSPPDVEFTEGFFSGEGEYEVNPLIVGLGATYYFN